MRHGRVRVGPLMAIPAVLTEHDVDPREVFDACGITVETFSDPEATISFVDADALLGRAVERTGCEHFALLVGQRAPAQSMGAVGYLMLSATTVGDALHALAAHSNVQDRGAVVSLRVDGAFAVLRYSLVVPGLKHPDQVYGLAIAVGQGIMRGLCGPAWQPHSVTFSFGRPQRTEAYRKCFGVMPRFDSSETALVFPAAQLAQPLPSADAYLNKVMRQHIAAESQIAAGDLVEDVRRIVRGTTAPGSATLESVALLLGIHERTLKRQLAASGTTFRGVRDGLLAESACELLQNTGIAVGEIASALGYTDPASFTRAFRRWAGTTPNAWRMANRPPLAAGRSANQTARSAHDARDDKG